MGSKLCAALAAVVCIGIGAASSGVPTRADTPPPTPQPVPSSQVPLATSKLSAEPLRVIGRIKATTTFCRTIIDHAVTAVEDGVDDDTKIASIVHTLRTSDFDSSVLSKTNALRSLNIQYGALTEQAVVAERAAKAMRVDANNAPNPQEAANVTAFADALDGALHRQRTIARDLAGAIARFGAKPVMTKMEQDEQLIDMQASESYSLPGQVPVHGRPEDLVTPLLSSDARDVAEDYEVRQTGIAHDERDAADLIAPTFGGC